MPNFILDNYKEILLIIGAINLYGIYGLEKRIARITDMIYDLPQRRKTEDDDYM